MSMAWNKDSIKQEIVVDQKKIPVVDAYVYLGVIISKDGSVSDHVEERSKKALGSVIGRLKNVQSWVGKNPSLLLEQLNVCFAPCLAWGTDVTTLKKTDVAVLDVTFYRYLRKLFRVRFDQKTKKWEKTNKEIKELANLPPPSEALPLARLKFFFHTQDKETSYPVECFLNGKIVTPNGDLLTPDKRVLTYSKQLQKDWTTFEILNLSKAAACQKCFQTNILTECGKFKNSMFASVAGKGTMASEEMPGFPVLKRTVFCFGTDGSLNKKEQEILGSFAVADSFGNFYTERVPCTDKTSSTTLELLALQKLFLSLEKDQISDCSVLIMCDSLSAIRLTLGLDFRSEETDILRTIDTTRKVLFERNVKDHFCHVRSHRNIHVPINREADLRAGSLTGSLGEQNKCKKDCKKAMRCSACLWNKSVNEFTSRSPQRQLASSLWE